MNRSGTWLLFSCAALLLATIPGCREQAEAGTRPTAPVAEPTKETRTAAELIRSAHEALTLAAGMPAPLSPTSTRKERQEYLQGMAQPLSILLSLPDAQDRNKPFEENVPPDLFERCADLFAVELADAIDRDEPQRASRALLAAFAYSDEIASRSVSQWVRANGLADRLCVGIRSVAGQVEDQIAEQIEATLKDIASWNVDPRPAIEFSERRVEEWRAKAISQTPVSGLLATYGTSLNGRQVLSPELAHRIRSLAQAKGNAELLSAATLKPEVEIAAEALLSFLRAAPQNPAAAVPLPDAEQHPIALLFVLYFRSEMELAPRLVPLRLESIRLVSLTARIIAANFPKDLTPFGEDAISPVTNLLFGYKVDGEDFELLRPR
ncbi:MAG: hypothetical protein D6724_09795 [Armatimonadetes bacterium]|nr:MAG: hypothetical protein D6724_09795 [Armatimonadota bacterium]